MKKTETPNSGEAELQAQLDRIKKSLANDLKMVNDGELSGFSVLSLDEKVYQRITDLLKLYQQPRAKTQKPDKEIPEDIPKITEPKQQPNIQDWFLKKI